MQGIYKIINELNGKYYVGSSKKLHKRWLEHKRHLRNKRHGNKHLQGAWDIYDQTNFRFEVLEELPDADYPELLKREQIYLDIARDDPKAYNMKFTAVGGWDWSDDKLKNSLPRGNRHKDYRHEIYEFENIETGEIFSGTRCDFYTKYGFMKHHVRELALRKRQRVKNWKMKDVTILTHSEIARQNYKNEFSDEIYNFIHTKTKETFSGNFFDFLCKYKLRKYKMKRLLNGSKISCGWRIM
jgi:group I intron endonuclease